MGCETSVNANFNEPLDQELEHELNLTTLNKNGQEIDRFQGNKPENGVVKQLFNFRNQLCLKPKISLNNSLWL
jgi:hypothetical protein